MVKIFRTMNSFSFCFGGALIVNLNLAMFLLLGCQHLPHDLSPRPEKNFFGVRWAQNLDPEYTSGNLPIALGSPTIYQHLLYMGTADGEMRAYDLETGRVLWAKRETGKFLGPPAGVHEDHIIYGSVDGRVYSRQAFTGELNYSIDLQSSVETAPTLYRGRAYFHLRNHKIVCLDAATGKVIWSYKRSVPYTTTIQRASRPLAIEGQIVVGMADGFLISFHPEDGSILWETLLTRYSKFVDVDADPIFLDGQILAGPLTGPLSLVDAKTGQVRRTLDYRISRSPIFDENYLYLSTLDGELVKLKRLTYDELFRQRLGSRALNSLNFWNDSIVVSSTRGELFLVSPEDLKLKARHHLGSAFSAIFGDLVVAKDYMATLSSRYRLYVFHQ